MALNFPDNPTTGQLYTDSTAGFTYEWDGVVWKSYTASASKNISIVDNIEGSFNGSTQTFALAVSGVPLTPANAQQLRVVLGGIVQEPITNYTVSNSNITFITAPIAGLDCSIVSLGPAVPVSVPGDGTVTPVKLSTGGPSWNTSGDVVITGTGTTALLVNGNARVTGILTVGTSSITLNGVTDRINVGTGLTLSSAGIQAGVVTATTVNATTITGAVSGNATGLSGSPSISVTNITGVAATFTGNVSIGGTLTYEDVTNVDSVGLITARAGVNVTGGSVVISSGGLSVSGVTTVAAGSAGAPSINPTGDNNTGLFFPAADTIAFSEGGAESARFNSSGNFIVGTTGDTGTASQRLQVTGNAYVSTSIGIGTTNPNGISGQASQLAMAGSNAGGGAGFHQFLIVSNTSATNPNKFFRLNSTGGIEIINSAYTLNIFTLDNSGNLTVSGNVTGYSDETLKDNIQTIPDALDKVTQLRGVEFDRNDIEGNLHQIGVIAQEVEEVIPEVVMTNEDGIKSVAYGNLVGLLIEAIKELKEEVNELKVRLEEI